MDMWLGRVGKCIWEADYGSICDLGKRWGFVVATGRQLCIWGMGVGTAGTRYPDTRFQPCAIGHIVRLWMGWCVDRLLIG